MLPKIRIRFTPTRWVIAIGIVYYLITVNLVAFAHDHEHADCCSEHCSACFFNANHVGIELNAVEVTNLLTCISNHRPITLRFICTILDNSVQSRAPPAFPV